MANYAAPGVYTEDVLSGARPIEAIGTSVAAIFGVAPDPRAHVGEPKAITSFSMFQKLYAPTVKSPKPSVLSTAVEGFFVNGGTYCYIINLGANQNKIENKHLLLLDALEDISVIVAPGYSDAASHDAMTASCEGRGDRFAILDTPLKIDPLSRLTKSSQGAGDGLQPPKAERGHAGVFTPWIYTTDAETGDRVEQPPSGHLAGLFALVDVKRGVHKAPANVSLRGAQGLTRSISDVEQELLNPIGINCIRLFHDGIKVWGSRTLAGASSDMRYIPIRRLVIMIAQSIKRGTRWVVFEPNDEVLWKSIRRDIGAFLNIQWRNGALRGQKAEQAYFVKCDSETTTQEDIDAGRVIAHIGLATVKPAEFVILRIGQSVDQLQVEEN